MLLIAVVVLAGALVGIPVIIGGNNDTSTAGCGEVAVILDTIRTIESGGNYTIPKNRGGASGAYQYVDGTWNNYHGYPSAYLAPPDIQDARATVDVQAVLNTYHDVADIPIIWYWPKAATDPGQLDIIPYPTSGNKLTVREYQQHWLAVYTTKNAAAGLTPECTTTTANQDGYALPIDRALIAAHPTMLDEPHHDYPAIDLLVPIGTAVYAAKGGTITRIVNWPYNCWEIGRCDQTCGIGITITGNDTARYTYCHGSRLNNLTVGTTVNTGQLLMWSGNTGRSGAPHLHFEIRVNNRQRCPQAFLRNIYNTNRAPPPATLTANGCTY
jgi:hypothetical protein